MYYILFYIVPKLKESHFACLDDDTEVRIITWIYVYSENYISQCVKTKKHKTGRF